MTDINKLWKYVKGLNRRTFVERTESKLVVDDPDDDTPATIDEVLEGMRKNLFATKWKVDDYAYHITNEELKYEYWCCGGYRNPIEAVDHYHRRHEYE